MLQRCVALKIVVANRLVSRSRSGSALAEEGLRHVDIFSNNNLLTVPLESIKNNRASFYGDKRIENTLRKL